MGYLVDSEENFMYKYPKSLIFVSIAGVAQWQRI
jgi:hypothetical protein